MPAISYDQAHGYGQAYDKPLSAAPAAKAAGPVSHLSPELEARLRDYQDDHRGPCTHPMANPAETWNGRCLQHKGTPAERAEERRWQNHAAATLLAQQLGRKDVHGWAPVYSPGEAEQLASRYGKPPLVDRLSFLP